MRYTHILDLIDADLDRLQMARELLTTSSAFRGSGAPRFAGRIIIDEILNESSLATNFKSPERKSARRYSERDKLPIAAVVASLPVALDELASAEHAPAPSKRGDAGLQQPRAKQVAEVRHESISARAERSTPKRRSMKSKLNVASSTTALGGAVPAGPVFIPVEKVRQEQATKEREQSRSLNSSRSAEEVPFTAESLAQRWLGSRAS